VTSTSCSTTHADPPVFRRSRSAGRGARTGRGYYHKAATSSPESETEAGIQLTPTALWPHHYNPVPTSSPTHLPSYPLYPSSHTHSEEDMCVKTSAVDLKVSTAPHLEWKYLQDLASPPGLGPRSKGALPPHTHRPPPQHPPPHPPHSQQQQQTMTCHQMTMAQVHTSHDLDNPDVFGFSVV
jgi:hypothetical protein